MKFLIIVMTLALGALGACTRRNPAVCCLDTQSCATIGVDELRPCSDGLACVDNECVTSKCSQAGCMAEAPVCNVTTDVCEACDSNADCGRFTEEIRCNTATGGCVECLQSSDCGPTEPVCAGGACRGCKVDAECETGACGDDGRCVAAEKIVYISPVGTDAGACDAAAPCRTVPYGLAKTAPARNHVVLATGSYPMPVNFALDSTVTTATKMVIHGGGGAALASTSGETPTLVARISVDLRDLEISSPNVALSLGTSSGTNTLTNVVLRASGIALDIGPGVHRLSNVSALGTGHSRGIRISDGANVSADRLKVQRFATCIDVNVGADPQLDLKNGAVFDCTERAMELQYATGLIEFTTVARSGANSGPGPRAVECTGQMTFRSSIIWAPGSERAAIAGCTLASTIAGPTAVPGASNADPLLTPDLRLGVGSPARDATQSGPPHDADANPRPIGAGYDLGAYETP